MVMFYACMTLIMYSRSKIHNQNQLQSELDHERSRTNNQQNQLMKLEAEVTALRSTEHELTELIGHLRVKIAAGNEELRRSKSQETTQHNTADKVPPKTASISH